MHTVDLVALGENGMVTLKSLTVKIDGPPPTASVTSAANGKLALSASDAGSGVKTIQYSVDGGAHWSTYSGVATIVGRGQQARPVHAPDQGHGRDRTHGDLIDRRTPRGLSYQWHRSGKAIAGATKWNYPIVAADRGTSLSVHVTERKTGYVPVTAVSASVLVHQLAERTAPGVHRRKAVDPFGVCVQGNAL